MKKLLIVFVALVAFIALGTTQAQNQCVANCAAQQMPMFSDVPAGHWAADAVDRITDLGIIVGFPDGNFNGNETLTRYQAALMFDRLINLLNANLASMQTIDDADIEALRRGVQSLSGEVAGLAQRVSANEVTIASISREYGAMHSNTSRISALELAVNELNNRPAQVVETRVVETVQVPVAAPAAAPQTVTQVVGVPDELVARINANTAAASRMDGLSARIAENSALIADISALTGRFDALSDQDAALAASIEDLRQQLARTVQTNSGEQDAALVASIEDLRQQLTRTAANSTDQDAALAASIEDLRQQLTRTAANSTDQDAALAASIEDLRQQLVLTAQTNSGEQDAALFASIEDLQQQVSRAQTQANAAMEQANLAIELFSSMPVNEGHQVVEDARVPVLNQRVVDNSRSVSALNDLMALFNSDLLALQSDVAALRSATLMTQPVVPEIDFTPLEDSIASNRSQIQGIREFAILLRRNQVAFDSRLNALEDLIGDSISGVEGELAILTNRVNEIESDLLTFSGSIAAEFKVIRIDGDNFDVDRVFGFGGFKRESLSGKSTFGNKSVRKADFAKSPGSSTFSTTLKVDLGFARESGGAIGDPRKLNTFGSAVTLKLKRAYGLCSEATCDPNKKFSGYVFTLGDALFYYDPIGADLLTFGFGQDVDVTFSDYVVNTNLKFAAKTTDRSRKNNINTPGFVGRLGSPDFLDFLAPKLTVVYTSPDFDTGSADLASYNYLLGIRGEMAPKLFDGFETSGGVSFATSTQHDREYNDKNKDNVTTTVFGVDGKLAYSPFTLEFEWARASRDEAGNATNPDPSAVFFATVGVEPFDISIVQVKSVEVTYRDIAGNWTSYDGLDNKSDHLGRYDGQATKAGRFNDDQAGIRASADFSLFIFDVNAYFDQYYIANGLQKGEQLGTSAFGLDADINIFAAFAVTGFFHSASIQDKPSGSFVQVDNVKGARPEGDSPTSLTATIRDKKNYDTGFGGGITHNGDSENALIPNLDFGLEFALIHAGFDTTRIRANAAYDLEVSFLHLTPYANFELLADPDSDVVNTTTTIQVGTNIETDTFDILFKPSFEGTVNYRNVSYGYTTTTKNYTANQLQYSVGVVLNEFLLPYSVLTARYGNFTGLNSSLNPGRIFTPKKEDFSRITSGYEVTWNYYDLEFAYGLYTNDPNSSDNKDPVTSQAFRIKYKVTF